MSGWRDSTAYSTFTSRKSSEAPHEGPSDSQQASAHLWPTFRLDFEHHLGKVEVQKHQCEELQADRAAVEKP